MSGIFNNSKEFVDMKCKSTAANTLLAYKAFISNYTSTSPTKNEIQDFVLENFEGPNLEYVSWSPPDLKPNPKLLSAISNPLYKAWASDLNQYWAQLGRKQIDDVANNPDRYSLIPLKNPIIVENSMARDITYWDNYWVILGLLSCEMYDVSIKKNIVRSIHSG